MDVDDGIGKRSRGRGRTTRARGRGGRGRGRGRGKKAVVVFSDEESSLDMTLEDTDISAVSSSLIIETQEDIIMTEVIPEEECMVVNTVAQETVEQALSIPSTTIASVVQVEEQLQANVLPQTIDMEADISQLEAPTFTTICRGPPEPMLRLKWDHKVNLIGEKVLNPMIHCCDQCDKPILVYGRMIPCKHIFCLKCARTEPIKICPRCNDKVVRVEQSGLGTVFMCTHGGSRYGNSGCRRTYLSQRDLQAHINHRHITQPPPPPPVPLTPTNEIKQDVNLDALKTNRQRKLSEPAGGTTALQTPSSLLTQRSQGRTSGIGTIPPPGAGSTTATQATGHGHSTLTQANIARINTANAQDCHQGKVALHQTLKKTPITPSHHQTPETVADASYYSSVLNSFGAGASNVSTNATSVGYGYDTAGNGLSQTNQLPQPAWQNQYYR